MTELPEQLPTFYSDCDDALVVPFTFGLETECAALPETSIPPLRAWNKSADIATAAHVWGVAWSKTAARILNAMEPPLSWSEIDPFPTKKLETPIMGFRRNDEEHPSHLWHPLTLVTDDWMKSVVGVHSTFPIAKPPVPDTGFFFDLVGRTHTRSAGPDLFCVAAPRTFLFSRPLFEMGLAECEASLGSIKTSGIGWLKSASGGQALLVGLLLFAVSSVVDGAKEPTAKFLARIDIAHELNTLAGPCHVKGHLTAELPSLIALVKAHLPRNPKLSMDPTICIEQAALRALKYDPGPIDGMNGPNTDAARAHFKNEWGLQKVSVDSVDYWQTLGKALEGSKPPASRSK